MLPHFVVAAAIAADAATDWITSNGYKYENDLYFKHYT